MYVPLWAAFAYSIPPLIGVVVNAVMQWRIQRKQVVMEAYQKDNHFETQAKLDLISTNTNGKLAEIDAKLSKSQAVVADLKEHAEHEKGRAEAQQQDRCKFIGPEGQCKYSPTGGG